MRLPPQAARAARPLHDDDVAEGNQLPDAAVRAAQLRSVLDGYELPAAERAGLVTT